MRVENTSLRANGWVDFSLSNNENTAVTIAKAIAEETVGTNLTYLGSALLNSSNVVASGGTLILSVQF